MSKKNNTRSKKFFLQILLREVSKYNLEDSLRRKLNIDFFLTFPFKSKKKVKTYLTLTANNSPLKSRTPQKYHIFGKLRTSAFSWWYPGYGIVFENFE